MGWPELPWTIASRRETWMTLTDTRIVCLLVLSFPLTVEAARAVDVQVRLVLAVSESRQLGSRALLCRLPWQPEQPLCSFRTVWMDLTVTGCVYIRKMMVKR